LIAGESRQVGFRQHYDKIRVLSGVSVGDTTEVSNNSASIEGFNMIKNKSNNLK
jgi:hypothetical protein